jgi:hypothetical protein
MLITAIQGEFATNVQVSDEGEYWETKDLDLLWRKTSFVQSSSLELAQRSAGEMMGGLVQALPAIADDMFDLRRSTAQARQREGV